MAPGLVRLALRRTVRDVRYVEAVPARKARGVVRDVYRAVERDFGMLAPPMALHSPSPPVLAAAWLMLRESLVAGGTASRADKEVVAASVSAGNSCPYCVEVHGMALGSLGDPGAAAAIEAGTFGAIENGETRALADWARGLGEVPDGVSAAAAGEFAAVATTFHYLNRMVSVFLGPSPLPPAVPPSARAKAKAVLGYFLKPGAAPEAEGTLADAFARAASAIEAAGERVLPPRVRDLVRRELKAWDGNPPGLSRAWVDDVCEELPGTERAAARLALLVAKAAYQVDETVVRQAGSADDRSLVELVSWASFAAADQLGNRLPLRPAREDRAPRSR